MFSAHEWALLIPRLPRALLSRKEPAQACSPSVRLVSRTQEFRQEFCSLPAVGRWSRVTLLAQRGTPRLDFVRVGHVPAAAFHLGVHRCPVPLAFNKVLVQLLARVASTERASSLPIREA